MRFYKLALYKAYFEQGYSVLSYVKYLFLLVGISDILGSLQILIVPLFLTFGILCFFLGKLWFYLKIADAEKEVQNNINPFVREVRESIKTKDI